MARRRKPRTITGMLLSMCFAPIKGGYKYVMNFKPMNSRGRKISRAKKKRWF